MEGTKVAVFAGYVVKEMTLPSDFTWPGAKALGSVAECMAPRPKDWINAWAHNDLWCYDSFEAALLVAPEKERFRYTGYAYKLLPFRWVSGVKENWDIPTVCPDPLPTGATLLGYDVVTYSDGGFGHSPLSCNGLLKEMNVNAFCLFDVVGTAMDLASKADASKCEPGPYIVVEVWKI